MSPEIGHLQFHFETQSYNAPIKTYPSDFVRRLRGGLYVEKGTDALAGVKFCPSSWVRRELTWVQCSVGQIMAFALELPWSTLQVQICGICPEFSNQNLLEQNPEPAFETNSLGNSYPHQNVKGSFRRECKYKKLPVISSRVLVRCNDTTGDLFSTSIFPL